MQIFKAFKKYAGIATLAPLCKLLEALLELLIPLLVARIIDVGIANNDRGYVVTVALIMAGVGLVGLLFSGQLGLVDAEHDHRQSRKHNERHY